MTDQAILTTQPAANSFIGLNAYTEDQAKIFFGRDEEIEQLTKLVKFNTLTILFGKSGTGKTSLLNAGVFPRLRNDYCLPFKIRLEFKPDSPELITQVKEVLKKEIDNYGFQVASYPGNETLWEYFHKEPLWKTITPILIFDQFEEIFTLAGAGSHFGEKEFAVFWEELSDLIENFIPKSLKDQFLNRKEEIDYDYNSQRVKVLFSFREEYLAEFESFTEKIPSIKLSRFRLKPMNEKQAYQVVKNTWGDKINKLQAEKVVSYFAKEPIATRHAVNVIEPSLLSQVCTYIEKERIKAGDEIITDELLNKYSKDYTLRAVYEEAIAESNAVFRDPNIKAGKKQPAPMSIFVQEKLITDKGFRTRYTLSEDDKKQLLPGILILDKKYFLRLDDGVAELTHDVLAPLIKDDREKERKALAAAIATKKARRRGLRILAALALLGLILFLISLWRVYKAEGRVYKAEEQRDQIVERINILKADSTRLSKIVNPPPPKGSSNNNNPADPTSPGMTPDPATNSLTTILRDSISTLEKSIIALNSRLKEKTDNYNGLLLGYNNLQKELTTRGKQSDEKIKKLEEEAARLNKKLADAEANVADAEAKIKKLRDDIDKLRKEFYEYRLKYPVTFTSGDEGNTVKPNANSLLLSFRTGSANNTKPADTLTIYLVPIKNNKSKILNDAKNYDIFCNGMNLGKMKEYQKAQYYKGQYFYNEVPKGEYLVKVCSYYGSSQIINWNGKMEKPITLPLKPPAK